MVAVREAGRPDLLPTYLGKALLVPVLRPLTVVGRGAALLGDLMAISSYLAHPLTPSFS
jgi:hypothetical protein